MILIEKTEVIGWEHAIRGMRNPMNSWDKGDSGLSLDCDDYISLVVDGEKGYYDIPHFKIGENDHELMMKLARGGPVHAKYRRMITVYMDITAPLYWWKEFDTYKVGTVANSCSTMHKIHAKEFVVADFSCEHLTRNWNGDNCESVAYVEHPLRTGFTHDVQIPFTPFEILRATINALNTNRDVYLKTGDKKYWWQMIQLLPSSYNQKRTVMLNYEVLVGIYKHRKEHKLDEWRDFCRWIEELPYSEIITCNPKEA